MRLDNPWLWAAMVVGALLWWLALVAADWVVRQLARLFYVLLTFARAL